MAFANTSAATWADFCNALTTFLTGAGWTAGGTAQAPIYTNANGHKFNVYTDQANRNDYYGGPFIDRQIRVNYDRGNIGGTAGQYSNADSYSNDWTGPFPNIWFFGTGEYVHIVVQSAAQRYSHLSFGDLDNKGVHAKKVCFTAGKWWYYWSDQEQYANNSNSNSNPFNYPPSGSHEDQILQGSARLGLPDGLVDPSLLFRSGPIENPAWKQLNDRELGKQTGGNNSGQWLDYHCCIQNKAYTGGIIVGPMPVFVWNGLMNANLDGRRDVLAFIGEFPDIGMVNMDLLTAGQIINFADDEWQVFPQKQYGSIAATKYGANPQPVCNTWNYGFAYKRVA